MRLLTDYEGLGTPLQLQCSRPGSRIIKHLGQAHRMSVYVEATAAGIAGTYCSVNLHEAGKRSQSRHEIKRATSTAAKVTGLSPVLAILMAAIS
jgi:hypothetical protein